MGAGLTSLDKKVGAREPVRNAGWAKDLKANNQGLPIPDCSSHYGEAQLLTNGFCRQHAVHTSSHMGPQTCPDLQSQGPDSERVRPGLDTGYMAGSPMLLSPLHRSQQPLRVKTKIRTQSLAPNENLLVRGIRQMRENSAIPSAVNSKMEVSSTCRY